MSTIQIVAISKPTTVNTNEEFPISVIVVPISDEDTLAFATDADIEAYSGDEDLL